jgi:hypothetical protein
LTVQPAAVDPSTSLTAGQAWLAGIPTDIKFLDLSGYTYRQSVFPSSSKIPVPTSRFRRLHTSSFAHCSLSTSFPAAIHNRSVWMASDTSCRGLAPVLTCFRVFRGSFARSLNDCLVSPRILKSSVKRVPNKKEANTPCSRPDNISSVSGLWSYCAPNAAVCTKTSCNGCGCSRELVACCPVKTSETSHGIL